MTFAYDYKKRVFYDDVDIIEIELNYNNYIEQLEKFKILDKYNSVILYEKLIRFIKLIFVKFEIDISKEDITIKYDSKVALKLNLVTLGDYSMIKDYIIY